MVAMSCGWIPLIVKDNIAPLSFGSPIIETELFFLSFSKPYSVISFSCWVIFLIPIFSINLMDSAKPTISAVCKVPASNLVGLSGKEISSLSGVQEFPMRVKCATMAWHTCLSAVDKKWMN